jgi:orotate phosphoribosyltransferase-like protein
MKCYVILREYHNNVAVVDAVLSSKKKAEKYIERVKYWCDKDGWCVLPISRYMNGKEIKGIEIQSPTGNPNNTERYYIITKEIE